jgi:ATPase subunit of ABC transporter with duplicated ATPase domains
MENYDKYLDMLMRNYPLQNESSDEAQEFKYIKKNIQDGGNKKKTKKKLKKNNKKISRMTNENENENEDENRINKDDSPFGGFPPIFLCQSGKKIINDENKGREYSKNNVAVSIKQIMQKRRDIIPFIL